MNFKKDTDYEKISKNYHFYYNQNPINSIFSLRLEWGIGKYENNSLPLASSFGAMIGNEQYSFNEFKEELQKIGATVDFFSTMNHTGINIKGFDKHFKKTIELAGSFLSSMTIRKEDKKKLKKLIQQWPQSLNLGLQTFYQEEFALDRYPFVFRPTLKLFVLYFPL